MLNPNTSSAIALQNAILRSVSPVQSGVNVTPPPLVAAPKPYIDNRTITPYLAIALDTIIMGKEKVKIPRFAIFYQDAPGYIWIMPNHPQGTDRPLADFSVYRFSKEGIISLGYDVNDTQKAQLMAGITGDELFTAITASYDVTRLLSQGYLTLDSVMDVLSDAQSEADVRHTFAVAASEAGLTPQDAQRLGFNGVATDMRNPAYQTIPAPTKSAVTGKPVSDSVPDTVSPLVTPPGDDIPASNMTIDLDNGQSIDVTAQDVNDTVIPEPVANTAETTANSKAPVTSGNSKPSKKG